MAFSEPGFYHASRHAKIPVFRILVAYSFGNRGRSTVSVNFV
jgi:hypothetical protein